jgi:cytochrome c oxidase subunit 2
MVYLTVGLLVLLASCSPAAPSIMDAKGPAARAIAQLGWLFFILGGIIFLAVMAYLAYALLSRNPRAAARRGGTQIVIIAGMIIPAVILVVLFVFNTNALGKVTAPNEGDAAAVIEVVGNQWWWEVTYQDPQFETANEIHIPVGKPVLLKLTSEDVIHSFWVPELHGKMDLIPGRVNDFWIQADEPGQYMGECAEYCGLQHANMQFLVIAEPQEQYDQWLAAMQQPARLPEGGSAARGEEIFLSTTCVQCHTIRGTEATGDLGPDLTHLASRRRIGSGILPLNRANLGGWVANPHGVKPGVLMPAADVSGADLQALLDFLMALE